MAWDDELDVAKRAAREAGEIMQDYREDGFDIDRKDSYTDMVTGADVACEEAVVETIEEAFPDDGFRTEEETGVDDGQDRVWVIDPIDGTKNFVHGFPFYCCSIALKVDDETVLGVVYAPYNDTMYRAVRGEGAYRDGDRIEASPVDALKDALVLTRLSERHEPTREVETPFLRELLDNPSAFRRPGSAALDCCMVADGSADAYVTVSISEWDIAAGALIITEAGGSVRIEQSVRDGYLEFIGTNGPLQDVLEEMLDRHLHDVEI